MHFNIIITPYSIQYLNFFVWSLLAYSHYQFRLVSNGCTSKERAILKKMCEQHARLSYWCFPTHEMQLHGKVLNYLQSMTTEAYFCFMDSDIFATASFPDMEQIMKKQNLTGLFSAMPLWVKQSESVFKGNFRSMIGTFNQTESGNCIGSTYFAIYRNDHLQSIMQHYGVSFEEGPVTALSPEVKKQLESMGFSQVFYDTGKVINLLLSKHFSNLKNIEIAELCHIGGTSYETAYQAQPISKKQKIKQYLLASPFRSFFLKYLKIRQEEIFRTRFEKVPKEEYAINYNQRILHRNRCRQHFLKLYLALNNEQSLPSPPDFEDAEIRANVRKAHEAYIEVFKKYH